MKIKQTSLRAVNSRRERERERGIYRGRCITCGEICFGNSTLLCSTSLGDDLHCTAAIIRLVKQYWKSSSGGGV